MEVGIRVETENVMTGVRAHTSTAYFLYVAVDPETRKPVPVPRLVAETPEEIRRMRQAEIRRGVRLARRAALIAQREQVTGAP
jgi:acyl-CoA hydrolase